MKKSFLFIGIFISLLFVGPTVVLAQGFGLEETAGAAGLQRGNIPTLAGNVIGTALSMIGVLFFILMVYGGFLWMTARGNEEQTTKAKNTIVAAVIGIIIVLASYAITNFIFQAVQNTPVAGRCEPAFRAPQECVPGGCVGVNEEVCSANPTCCMWTLN